MDKPQTLGREEASGFLSNQRLSPGGDGMPRAVEDLRTDHLLLLVGGNPLPNFVATLLLARKGTRVQLIHSRGTEPVAANLRRAIEKLGMENSLLCREVPEADSSAIVRVMDRLLKELGRGGGSTVGLHYTGGTKAMAVHAYRCVERSFPDAVFTYLDPRTLSLVVDGSEGAPAPGIPVARACTVSLEQLLELHGCEISAVRRKPRHSELCQALAQVHASRDSLKQWRDWLDSLSRSASLPDPAQPEHSLLEPVRQAFAQMCGNGATPEEVARRLCQPELRGCAKWLVGEWLEEYVLWSVEQATRSSTPGDYGIDLKLKTKRSAREWQFDVVAMRGYQLHALSCIASEVKEKCKHHLFEAYVRARQMGGDESRVGLVCCYCDPAALEDEVNEAWFAEERVRVFGQEDLVALPDRLRNWFDSTAHEGGTP